MQSYCLQRAGAAEHAEHVNVCVCVWSIAMVETAV